MPRGKTILGKTVRDTVSGFVGVAVCQTKWLYGCVRYGVQGPVDKEGKLPELNYFDEDQLEVVKVEKPPKKKKKSTPPQGPRPGERRGIPPDPR